MEEEIALKCRGVIGGKAKGEALVATEPISFWGGIDPKTGRIIDKKSGSYRKNISGKVFVFPYGKGSSTSSAVFLEAVRCNKAPVAIVNVQTEPLLTVGVILGMKLYGKSIPVVDHVEKNPCEVISNQDFVEVDAERGILVIRRPRVMKEGRRVGKVDATMPEHTSLAIHFVRQLFPASDTGLGSLASAT